MTGKNNNDTNYIILKLLFIYLFRIQSDVRVGDIIHIVASCSTLSGAVSLAHSKDYFVISNDNGGCIIINPDYLISVTNLSNGITCTRR